MVVTFRFHCLLIILALWAYGVNAFPMEDEMVADPEKACSTLRTEVEDRVNVTSDGCWTLCSGFCTAILNLGLSGRPHSEFGVMTEAEKRCALARHIDTFQCIVREMATSTPGRVCVNIIDTLNDLSVEHGGQAYLPTNESQLLNVSNISCSKDVHDVPKLPVQDTREDHISPKLFVTDAAAKHQAYFGILAALTFACMMWL
mmetsp:Transcript_38342/g.57847  ORF Transcript_38342/g.57847 Transcript_38342/m.57847 type:complete len:202 (+) Transcript_38342:121-726(+)|eukprot:CAMPEP_0194754902 /NCGR_PEP_ID=MMETSP0323_2-20130528/8820_1 /TAXON_ID=2866 ORGANISM="Crypthecodinium cohnii, Strain Seligo" /NCGR_SAMPLE_ID=MMETSP0323_2 /ASSEMBLY_ACC=CAM_ASM_000346 /LENGTH=201 /DNA_ID=CAMNT_0039673677 /DNA_START=81 /DNA_END=686 /DNA_ORIENTATION=+